MANAAEQGDEGTVRSILLSGIADLETKDHKDETALSLAIRNGHTNVVRLLLDAGVSLDTFHKSVGLPDSLLDLSAKLKDPSVMKLLLDTGRLRVDESILRGASEAGNSEVVRLILGTSYAYFNWMSIGSGCLIVAAENGHADVVKVLLENGVAANANTVAGKPAAAWACQNGHFEVFNLLLATGQIDLDLNFDGEDWNIRRVAEWQGWDIVERFCKETGRMVPFAKLADG